MRLLVAAGALAGLLACAAAAAIDEPEQIVTDDAIIVEAADLGESPRLRRQLWMTYEAVPLVALPYAADAESPAAPRDIGACATADGRSGTCLTRTSCSLTREAEGDDLQRLERTLGNCVVIDPDSSSRRGEPSVRGICCPSTNALFTRPPLGGQTQWWQTVRPEAAPTHWWQAGAGGGTTPSPPAAAAPTRWWQATGTPASQVGSTQWWQSTYGTSTTQPPPVGATQWWQSTAKTTTTRAPPAGATQWWQSTAKTTTRRPTTSRRPSSAPPRVETSTTKYPFITHAWQATKKTTPAPGGGSAGGGAGAGATQWWQSTHKPATAPTTVAATQWWESTTAAQTQRPTVSATQWWEATTAQPTTQAPTTATQWWATTTTTKPPTTGGATQWWETTTAATAQPAPAPAGGGGGNYGACGTFSTEGADRIVGGSEAEQGEFPWLAGIFKGPRQFCGGSLIDNTHILTAAHCVAHMTRYDVAQLTVRLGDHDISTKTEAKDETFRVARIVRHKEFTPQTLHKDIALITLAEPVIYKSNIRPVCLDSGGATHDNEIVTVAGWGSLREGGRQPSRLMKVSLKVWTNADCKATYGPKAPGGIIPSMLCAGRQGKDSCSGDSGGPLMKLPQPVTQVGVVSWGIGCGKAQYPGVYTRVSHLLDWINRNKKEY